MACLIRSISLVATLTLAARIAAAPGTCGIQVVPLHDANSTPQLAPISISADGRFLAFASYAPLLPGDTNGKSDIYVFDTSKKQLTIESALPDGRPANTDSLGPDISDDGRFLAFQASGRLISISRSDEALTQQIVLRDRQLGTTTVLSTNDAGEHGNDKSSGAVISGDGRVVAFESHATNLVPGADGNGAASDVYAVTVATRAILRVSTTSTGRQPAKGTSFAPSISGDGQLIAFASSAWLDEEQDRSARQSSKALPPHRELPNVFLRDLARGTTRRISRTGRGEPNGPSYLPAVSEDGRWVAFVSNATDFLDFDPNEASDVFLHDLHTSKTSLISRSASGGTADGASSRPALSANGQYVVFESDASNLVCSKRCPPRELDINLLSDVFVFDRLRGVITRLSKDPESAWMEPSRFPAIDGSGSVIAFSSRRPIDDRDRRDDFDLFVRRRCE